jgi:zinc transport system ATP-binding protein
MRKSNDPILNVNHLEIFQGDTTIITDLSFTLSKKDNLVIIGPNGAGKTILLRALLGILPFRGEIKWQKGIKFGYVPQRVPLVKDIPVTLSDFFRLKNISEESANQLLADFGLGGLSLKKKQLGLLSSGQFQRVLIAWAISSYPDVLILDEPFSAIDLLGQEVIYQYINRLQKVRGLTVLLVTHDLNIVSSLSNKVLCLNKDKFCFGKPHEILNPDQLSFIYGGPIKFVAHHNG